MAFRLRGSSFGSMALAAGTLAACLSLTGVSRLRAGDDDCQRRVARADHRLHEAIEHHGYQSEQADHARHELREARERCWKGEHRWWDEDNQRWHSDQDWDQHDHDGDRH